MRGRQPHIQCKPGDVAELAFLVGDPGRIALVAERLEDAQEVANNRGLPVWNGTYKGVPVTVVSTGMGCPSAAIVVEELANIGVKTFIRIGTCGGLKEEIQAGDLIIPTEALRAEGTTKEYVGPEFVARADKGIVDTLEGAAREAKVRYWKGVNRTHDAFYEPVENMLKLLELYPDGRAGEESLPLVSSEMECSAVFVIALLRGLRAGAVLAVNTVEPLNKIKENPAMVYELSAAPEAKDGVRRAIDVALEAGVRIMGA
ncbi:MAG: nucleoside phosphorylase [Candidatus Brennerbacteria bacterium]